MSISFRTKRAPAGQRGGRLASESKLEDTGDILSWAERPLQDYFQNVYSTGGERGLGIGAKWTADDRVD